MSINQNIFTKNSDQDSYWLHKKTSIHQGIAFFLQRDNAKNRTLLTELLFEKNKNVNTDILKQLEEDWVIAQILCEEQPSLNEHLQKDPQNFFICLLLCSLAGDKEQYRLDLFLQKNKMSKKKKLAITIALLITAVICYNHFDKIKSSFKNMYDSFCDTWTESGSPPGSPGRGPSPLRRFSKAVTTSVLKGFSFPAGSTVTTSIDAPFLTRQDSQ